MNGKLRLANLAMLEEDLTARVKNLVALERQKLIDTYLSWGDRYGASLLDLERRRETSTARLKSRLQQLNCLWPEDP